MAEKKSFIVRHENIEQFEMLTPEQQGALFMAMCYYSRDKKETAFDDPMLKMLFSVMRGQMSRDAEKYEVCARNVQKAVKKAALRKETVTLQKQAKQAKQTKQAYLFLCVSLYLYLILYLYLFLILRVCVILMPPGRQRLRRIFHTRHTRQKNSLSIGCCIMPEALAMSGRRRRQSVLSPITATADAGTAGTTQ